MTTYNRNFAKPAADMTPLFASVPLRIAIHHHEEWDEDIIDPETGEPTGEKAHKFRDWTEYETVLRPTVEQFALAGYKPLYDTDPGLHEHGKHWERTGKIKDADTYWFWEYVLVDDPPPPPRRWTRLALKTALAQAEMLDAAKAYLQSVEIATSYTALEALTDADYIEEFYGGKEKWNMILDGAADALGKTRVEVDAFLDAVPMEGGI